MLHKERKFSVVKLNFIFTSPFSLLLLNFNGKHTLWAIYVFNIALVNRDDQNPLQVGILYNIAQFGVESEEKVPGETDRMSNPV